MDNNSFTTPPTSLHLDENGIDFLKETGRWAYFLSIVGFVLVGLLVLLAIFMGTFLGSLNLPVTTLFPAKIISVEIILFAGLYLLPVIYMYRFAIHTRYAIRENNIDNPNAGLRNMKSLFKFMGIFTIVIISIYLIVIVSAIVYAILSSH